MPFIFPAAMISRRSIAPFYDGRGCLSTINVNDGFRPGRDVPHILDIVEVADFGPEHMHHHVAGIEENPIAIGHALDMDAFDTRGVQLLHQIIRDRADMPVHPAGRHDHEGSDGGFAVEVDGDALFCLHVVKAGEDQLERVLGGRPRGGLRNAGLRSR